jgi:acyl-coenzyme A thioesterase PaaI-like protein
MRFHPGVQGRATEMADLAQAVRRLVAATMLNRGEPAELVACTRELAMLADRLEAQIPSPPPSLTDVEAGGTMVDGASMSEALAFDVVIGRYSPLALPVEIEFDPPRALGRAVFTAPYEGPPGCVHGAVIAATFDIVLTAANVVGGMPGLTASLSTRFARPILLNEPTTFEATVVRMEGRRIHTRGQAVQRGVVAADSEGVFVHVDRERDRPRST